MKSAHVVHLLGWAVLLMACLVSCSGGGSDGDDTSDGDALMDGDVTDDDDDSDGDAANDDDDASDPLFLEGCPQAGLSTARTIANPAAVMQGPDAVGRLGDTLLMNEKAAFVISAPENRNTYYIYGGIVTDAVAVEGCKQANLDRFEEAAFVVGKVNATNYYQSVLRGFRADTVEVVNDGSDGQAAVVRATGTDDYFWLVDLVLASEAYKDGQESGRSRPFELEIVIDYILPPLSSVLTINVSLRNTKSEELKLVLGAEAMFGDTTTVRYYADSVLDIAGYSIEKGIPWMASSNGNGAWAIGQGNAEMMSINIGGITAILDFNQVLVKSIELGASGTETDHASFEYFLAVGPTDSNSAVRHLQEVNPEPLPDMSYTLKTLSGNVLDENGAALPGVLVELQAFNSLSQWMVMDSFYADETGAFGGQIPSFGRKTPDYRLVAKTPGRPDGEPFPFTLDTAENLSLTMAPAGSLTVAVTDDDGNAIPAKVLLYQDGVLKQRIFFAPGEGPYPVVPGDYTYSISRGYEYDVLEGDLSVAAAGQTDLSGELAHLVDTTGYLSIDTHCHAGPSPDNTISIPDRIRTVAAEGLDAVVSTDHEFINDWSFGVDEAGLNDFVATVIGEEVTAAIPNHTNAFPLVPDYELNGRGGYMRWFGMDLDEIFAMERERGAQITQLNHPRKGNYMTLVDYDRLTGEVALQDPTLIGLEPDAALWSWNFDTFELMNDPEVVFMDPANPAQLGTFDDWMSFLNLGHRITAVGVSDAHDYNIPGRPRSYFPAASDAPAQFDEGEMVAALKEGRSLVSAGAFARILVNDTATMGDTLTDSDGQVNVTLHVEALPQIDLQYIKVFVNCDEALQLDATAPHDVVKYDGTFTVEVPQDAHLVVLGFGEEDIPTALGNYSPARTPRFTTNAVFIDVDGNGTYDAPGGKECTYNPDRTVPLEI